MATNGRRPTYRVECIRSDGWWAIEVPELRGVHTQARRLEQVEDMVRDAIALRLDVPEDSFDVDIHPVMDGALEAQVDRARQLRADAERIQREALAASDAAAHRLIDELHLTVRDAAALLGISYQRIAQLTQGSSRAASASARTRSASVGSRTTSRRGTTTRPRTRRTAG